MSTILFVAIGLHLQSLVNSQFYAPECLPNYTTFVNNRFDDPNSTLILINGTEANHCGNICYNYTNCTGFSYIPSPWHRTSQCILTSLPFSVIPLDYDFGSAFYLKSNSSCNFYNDYHYIIIIVTGISLLALCTCCCYNFGKRQIRRSEYKPIN